MKKKRLYSMASIPMLVLFIMVTARIAIAGTIDPDNNGHKFAYGENIGWLTLEPEFGGGVNVSDTEVTGYAWAPNVGWINLSPENYGGVVHDGSGNLSGWGWGEKVGWISFSCEDTGTCGTVNYGVKVDTSTGLFSGYAWGANIGWINFNLTAFSDTERAQNAYGENIGWLDLVPAYGGITVTDTEVTGYAWAANVGWINLSPENYGGVVNDGSGNLSGWGWGERVGWVSFSCEDTNSCPVANYGVKIDTSTGLFSGYAWGTNIGWISFNLAPFLDYIVKTAVDHTISGNVGVDGAGATLSYYDGGDKMATADGSGDYSFTVSYNWSDTVTPSKTGFTFDPAQRTYSNVTTDQTGQDFTATPITPTIAGNAGIDGATLSYMDGSPKTATADGSGDYSFTVSYDWNGTVTPSKTGKTFVPTQRTYANVTTDQPGQDYTASDAIWNVTPMAGSNGGIDPSNLQMVTHNHTIDFNIKPAAGYRVVDPVDGSCGGSYTGDPYDTDNGITYTTDPVTGNCTVSATFTSAAPIVTTNAATSVGETTAVLNGDVDPNGLGAMAWFEWGTDQTYGNRLPESPSPGFNVGSGGSTPVLEQLKGLNASTLYHYAVVAENSAGIRYGIDRMFLTGEINSTCGDHWPIKIEREDEYESFTGTLMYVINGDVILLGQTPVSEDVHFDVPGLTLLLEGGWSCDFGSRTGPSSIVRGSITIIDSVVIMDGVTIW